MKRWKQSRHMRKYPSGRRTLVNPTIIKRRKRSEAIDPAWAEAIKGLEQYDVKEDVISSSPEVASSNPADYLSNLERERIGNIMETNSLFIKQEIAKGELKNLMTQKEKQDLKRSIKYGDYLKATNRKQMHIDRRKEEIAEKKEQATIMELDALEQFEEAVNKIQNTIDASDYIMRELSKKVKLANTKKDAIESAQKLERAYDMARIADIQLEAMERAGRKKYGIFYRGQPAPMLKWKPIKFGPRWGGQE